jgi:hypothetical protein
MSPNTNRSPSAVPAMPTMSSGSPVTSPIAGPFVSGSLIQPTDGSESPITIIPDGYGIKIPSDSADVDWPLVPIGAVINFAQTLPLVTDTSLKAWLKQSLSSLAGGKFTFSDNF